MRYANETNKKFLVIFFVSSAYFFFWTNFCFSYFRSFFCSFRCYSHFTFYPPKTFTVIFWKQINFELSQGCVFVVIHSFSQFNLFSFLFVAICNMRYHSLLFRFFSTWPLRYRDKNGVGYKK